jgi:hypothetical protein
VAHRDVERLRGDVLLGAVGDGPLDARGDGFDDRWMKEAGFSRPRQFVGERLRLFRRDVQTEDLDRDQPISRRLVGTEDRPECADTDLMQDSEGSKRRRWGERAGIVCQ